MTDPHLDKPTPEVAPAGGSTALPGASKGYAQLPTGPVPFAQTESGPDADVHGVAEWEPSTSSRDGAKAERTVEDARLAPWALFAAIVALATSMFVGWGIPVAIVSVMAALMSLRRPIENREMATWALVLGLFAALFSAGWLLWATMQSGILGA